MHSGTEPPRRGSVARVTLPRFLSDGQRRSLECMASWLPLRLDLDTEPIRQPVHEREVRNDFGGVQHGLVGVPMRAQLVHVLPRHLAGRPGEPARIREECPQLRRKPFMSAFEHRFDNARVRFNLTERRPVMFDSVMAPVVARDLHGNRFALGPRER